MLTFCSIAMAGAIPVIRSTSGLLILPRNWRAFDVASLALGEDGVERERRLARARQSGYDDQLVMGYLDLYVLEIMYPGAFDVDVFPFFRVVHASIPNRPLKITNFSQNYYPRTERFDKRPVRPRRLRRRP